MSAEECKEPLHHPSGAARLHQKPGSIPGIPSPASMPTSLFESWTPENRSGPSDQYRQSSDLKQELKLHFSDLDDKIELMRKQLCDCLDGIKELQLRPTYGSAESPWHSERKSTSSDLPLGTRPLQVSDTNEPKDCLRDVGRMQSVISTHSNTQWLKPSAPWHPELHPGVASTTTNNSEALSRAIPQMLRLPSALSTNTPSQSMAAISGTTSLVVTGHRRSLYAQILWEVLEEPGSSRAARNWARFWLCFITASVLSTLLLSLDTPYWSGAVPFAVEVFFELAFVAELLVRYSVCPSLCYFSRNTSNILDVVSVVPLVLRAATGFTIASAEDNTDIGTWLLLNVVPVLRLAKILRFTCTEWELFKKVLESVWGALGFLLFIGALLLLIFSALIYLVEPRDNIESFARAIWLTLVTMTTVGYGDVFPVTAEGRAVIALLMVFSALYLSMPIGLLGSAFTQIWQDRDRIILVDNMRRRLKQWGYDAQDTPMLFKRYDSDNDGEINLGDFRKMLQDFGIILAEERIVELFGTFDNDNSGSVDDSEFIKVLFPQTWHDMKEEARQKEEGKERRRRFRRKELSRSQQLLKSQQESHKAQQAQEDLPTPPPPSLSIWGRSGVRRISGTWARKSKEALGEVSEDPDERHKVSPFSPTRASVDTIASAPEGGPPLLRCSSKESAGGMPKLQAWQANDVQESSSEGSV